MGEGLLRRYRLRVNPLNLEAAAGRCARCVHALCVRALGRVVAGRFWCSYAWVSLTQTAPVRPRGCLCACVRVCACSPVCARAGVCAGVCAFL